MKTFSSGKVCHMIKLSKGLKLTSKVDMPLCKTKPCITILQV